MVNEELLIFGGVFPNPDPIPDGCSNDVHFFSTGRCLACFTLLKIMPSMHVRKHPFQSVVFCSFEMFESHALMV